MDILFAGAGRFLARAMARQVGHPYVDFSELFDTFGGCDRRLAGDCASAVSVAFLMGGGS